MVQFLGSISPVTIEDEWKESAFALFEADDGNHFCVLLPKIPPFSKWIPKEKKWNYMHFLHSNSSPILKTCRDMIEKIHSTEANKCAFSVKEIDRLNQGERELIATIAAQHGATNEQKVTSEELVVRERDQLIEPKIEGNTLQIRSTIYNTGRTRSIDVNFVDSLDEQTVKPLLLWLPPWGIQDWSGTTKLIDDELRSHYRVAHLSYSQNEEEYTFTGAGLDMRVAIEQVIHMHDRLKVFPKKIVLVGVSVSAFMAAELAKLKKENISALCLLMPAADLFGALDTFRLKSGKELFTRKFYLAKDGFRANQVGQSLNYFNGCMELYHLFDLSLRGAKQCNLDYFVENVKEFIKAGGRVCVACSKQDTMTKPDVVESLKELLVEKDCVFRDIEWFHDVKRGMRYYSQVKPNTNGIIPAKIKHVVRWLIDQSQTSSPNSIKAGNTKARSPHDCDPPSKSHI